MYSSVGATLHLHYCMGEFVNVSFDDTTESICGKCGMESHAEKKECCKDVPVTLKVKDSHYSSNSIYFFENKWEQHCGSLVSLMELPLLRSFDTAPLSFIDYSPPDFKSNLFLRFRNLRI